MAKKQQNEVRKVRKVRNVPVRTVRTGYEKYESPLGLVLSVPYRRMELEPAKPDSPLARRLLKAEGAEALSLVKTLQSRFGAKPVWYQDAEGEVGKKPEWVDA